MKNLEEDFGLFELPKPEDQAKQILAEYQGHVHICRSLCYCPAIGNPQILAWLSPSVTLLSLLKLSKLFLPGWNQQWGHAASQMGIYINCFKQQEERNNDQHSRLNTSNLPTCDGTSWDWNSNNKMHPWWCKRWNQMDERVETWVRRAAQRQEKENLCTHCCTRSAVLKKYLASGPLYTFKNCWWPQRVSVDVYYIYWHVLFYKLKLKTIKSKNTQHRHFPGDPVVKSVHF